MSVQVAHQRMATLVLCGVALLQIVGCTRAHDSRDDVDAPVTSVQKMTGATAVTISVPNPLSPIAPVLVGVNSVTLSGSTNVLSGTTVAMGSGGIDAEPDVLMNDVWSRGTAYIKDRAIVRGTLYAKSAVLGSNVVISNRNTAPVFDPPSTLSWTVTYPSGSPVSYTVNSGQTKTLAPGLYGAITLNSGATLNLSAGTYYLTTLDVESSAKVNLDQTYGPIVIYETTNLILRGSFVSTSGGSPDLVLGYLGVNPVYVESVFSGAIIAPNASLTLRQVQGTHSGFFYASNATSAQSAKIQYSAPFGLLTAAGVGLQQCATWITPPSGQTGNQAEVAFQATIARYCSMPGTSQCTAYLVGRANVDYTSLAKQLISQTISPAQFIAVNRDRSAKLQAAQATPALANALCTQPDSDNDWVVDSQDKCPGTPDLTATDSTGCPITTLPTAPSAADVQTALGSMGILYNPYCNGAPPPHEVAGAAVYQAANPANGTFIVAQRVTNQPAGCPVWYNFEIREVPASGTPSAPFGVAFKDTEEVNPVGGLAGLPNVPSGLIQFNAKPTDPGSRGTLGAIPMTPDGISFRVEAINGGGERGPWSQWKTPSQADCLALGVTCGTR